MVTYALIGICVAMFAVQQAVPGVTDDLAMLGSGGQFASGVAEGRVYRLLTASVLHAGTFHLLFNMLALYFVGNTVEPILGRARYLALYVLAAVGGSTASMLAHPYTFSVGASGAVFGLFGAFFVLARRMNADTGPIVGLIVVNGVLGFVIPQVDWQAHLGGLVVGGAFTAILVLAPRAQRSTLQALGGAAVLSVVLALVALRSISL